MELENRLKKELSEATVKALLEDAKFRVVPFGVESQLRDIACLSKKAYFSARLPEAMRRAPDFIVLSPAGFEPVLVEVKFRKTWSTKIFTDIARQVELYDEILLVCVVARSKLGEVDAHIRGTRIRKTTTGVGICLILEGGPESGEVQHPSLTDTSIRRIQWEELETLSTLFNSEALKSWPLDKMGVLAGLLTQ